MNLEALLKICESRQIVCHTEEPMAKHTTFRIGGPCRALVEINSTDDCIAISELLKKQEIPYHVIGRGSNLLVPDEGYDGVVLLYTDETVNVLGNGQIYAAAGASLKKLCVTAQAEGLSGLEFAYGIPGTVGGGVFMNAGAYDGELSNVLKTVYALDSQAKVCIFDAKDLALSYRHSAFMDERREDIILGAEVQLTAGDPAEIKTKMDDFLRRRQEKQPLEYPSAGSTFKRPKGSFASKLIDECGLRGKSVGGAQVSEKHAGFVINRGGATFADVMELCRQVREIVQKETGFVLEMEPEILR